MRTGFIGLGIMGASMARNLMNGGHRLVVCTRTHARAESLLAEGAEWRDTPAAVARDVDAVITMVGLPAEVEAVTLAADGVLAGARPGTLVIDMGTSPPALARRIATAAAERGLEALDAPVSGGDVGARSGALAIMVGGAADAFARALPLFQCMGRTIVHLGPAGSGQHCKMVNQIVIAGTMMGVAEGLSYASRAGLDPAAVLGVIGGGAAASFALSNLGPRMIAGDFAPGFMIEHFVKDMGIAGAEATALGLDLRALALARSLYGGLMEAGHGRDGTQALFAAYGGSAAQE